MDTLRKGLIPKSLWEPEKHAGMVLSTTDVFIYSTDKKKKLLQYLQKVDKKTDTNIYSKDFLNVRKPNKLSVNQSPAFVAKRHLAAVQIPARLSRDSFRRHKIEVHFIAWTARWEVHFRYATLVRDKVTAEFECFFESTRGTWQSFCQRPLRWDYLSNALNDVMTIKMCVSPKRRQQFGLYSFVY